jgi:hypothetical protein
MHEAVTVKSVALVAVLPPTVTVTGPVVAPAGTEVEILVAVLAVTTAVVPLKLTILLAGVGSKFIPVMVTVVPMGPDVGENEVMAIVEDTPSKTPILVEVKLVVATSNKLSWLKSDNTNSIGFTVTAKL